MATRKKVLRIENFGPIRKVEVPFADITVLVGPQATGKSLVLQWLKLAVEQKRIPGTLARQGFDVWNKPRVLAGRFFGRDYADSVTGETSVTFGGSRVELKRLAQESPRGPRRVLYIPAHRALVMGTGWPLHFRAHSDDTPYVVREFSDEIWRALSPRSAGRALFHRGFPREIRRKLDDALFHKGYVNVERDPLGKLELKLVHARRVRLSTMEWTTGQREVFPLLIGLELIGWLGSDRSLSLMPALEWVMVEEPELGLHPDGVLAIMALLLEVSRRGYRLVLSTHSQLVLDVLWSMQQLRGKPKADRKLLQILGLEDTQAMRTMAQGVLRKEQSITYLSFGDGAKVRSSDITGLDLGSQNEDVAQWGGLLGHFTRIADVVASSQ